MAPHKHTVYLSRTAFLCLHLVLIGCRGNQYAFREEIKGIQKKIPFIQDDLGISGSELVRAPAANQIPVCLKDRVETERLSTDVRALEAKIVGPQVKGLWQSLDLSVLPRSQAIFLSRYPKEFDLMGVSTDSCKDLDCLLTALYKGTPEKSRSRALKHYWWYLKMGNDLSPGRRIPTVSDDPDYKLEEILYSDEELSGFWILSQTLPQVYRNLASINAIYRLGRNQYLPKYGESTCGLSSGNRSSGEIILMDKCLSFKSYGDPGDLFKGFFYTGVPHEMTHSLDRVLAPQNERYLSDTEAWLSLSGWHLEEIVDPDTGKPLRQWKVDEKKDGFVRDYAGTTPTEDFADSAAYFRYSPDELQKVAPRKVLFFKNILSGGRTYTRDGLLEFYKKYLSEQISSQLVAIVDRCLAEPTQSNSGSYVDSAIRQELDFNLAFDIPAEVRGCIKNEILAAMNLNYFRLRESDYEFCGEINSAKLLLQDELVKAIIPTVAILLGSKVQFANAIRASAEFKKLARRKVDSREIYLACNVKPDLASCYKESLQTTFDSLIVEFHSDLGDSVGTEREQFFATYNLEKAKVDVSAFFSFTLSGIDPELEDTANSTWKSCSREEYLDAHSLGKNSGSLGPLVSPFDGGEVYVSEKILNCLNSLIGTEVENVRDQYLARLGIQLSSEGSLRYSKEFLTEKLLPLLQQIVDSESKVENSKRAVFKDPFANSLRATLLKDLSWLNSSMGSTINLEGATPCVTHSLEILRSSPESLLSTTKIPVRFVSPEDLINTWIKEVCQEISSGTTFKEKQKEVETKKWNSLLPEIEGLFVKNADIPATSCIQSNPKKGPTGREARLKCMKTQGLWSKVVNESISEFWAFPGTAYFKEKRAKEFTAYINKNNSKYWNDAISRMEVLANK